MLTKKNTAFHNHTEADIFFLTGATPFDDREGGLCSGI
jgi:hypothetical protein